MTFSVHKKGVQKFNITLLVNSGSINLKIHGFILLRKINFFVKNKLKNKLLLWARYVDQTTLKLENNMIRGTTHLQVILRWCDQLLEVCDSQTLTWINSLTNCNWCDQRIMAVRDSIWVSNAGLISMSSWSRFLRNVLGLAVCFPNRLLDCTHCSYWTVVQSHQSNACTVAFDSNRSCFLFVKLRHDFIFSPKTNFYLMFWHFVSKKFLLPNNKSN